MTRKDYIKIASIIEVYRDKYSTQCPPDTYFEFKNLARDFADMLQEDNPNFNYSRFITACGYKAD